MVHRFRGAWVVLDHVPVKIRVVLFLKMLLLAGVWAPVNQATAQSCPSTGLADYYNISDVYYSPARSCAEFVTDRNAALAEGGCVICEVTGGPTSFTTHGSCSSCSDPARFENVNTAETCGANEIINVFVYDEVNDVVPCSACAVGFAPNEDRSACVEQCDVNTQIENTDGSCYTCPETSTPDNGICLPDNPCRDDQISIGGICQCPPDYAELLGQCVATDCGPGSITTITEFGYQCSCPENAIPLLGSDLGVVGCTTTFCSTNPDHWTCRDTDNDGIPDPDDTDDDNDGIPDPDDPDDDNDGDLDTLDPDHRNYNKPDQDQDGIPDPEDPDVDGDGIPNPDDPDYLEQPDLDPPDTDNDGETDDVDRDDDNDGIPDPRDLDRDGDGNRDDLDAIPDPNTCDPSVDPSCQGGGGTCVAGFNFNESTRECLPIRGDVQLGNCQNEAISCEGDPLECAAIQLRYTEYCENNRGDANAFGEDLFDGSEVGGAGTEDVGFDTLVYDTDNASCPSPVAISIPNLAENIEITYQPMCDLATQLRLVFLFIGSLVGMRVNYRALTS